MSRRYSTEPGEAQFVPSFESFYAAEFRGVLTMLVGMVRHRWMAEEITQEAFLRAHRDWEAVAVHPNPAGWVRRVAINMARSVWRRSAAETRALLRLGRPETVAAPSAEWVDLWDAVDGLSRRQREVVVLHYFTDLPTAEIADVLGVREGTVRATLHQARQRLAGVLEVEA